MDKTEACNLLPGCADLHACLRLSSPALKDNAAQPARLHQIRSLLMSTKQCRVQVPGLLQCRQQRLQPATEPSASFRSAVKAKKLAPSQIPAASIAFLLPAHPGPARVQWARRSAD